MRKILVYLLLFVLAVTLIVFLVANDQKVMVNFDPVNQENPAFAIGPYPLSYMLSASLFIGFGLGGLGMWFTDGTLRRKARERKREIKRLKRELELANVSAPAGTGSTLPAVQEK